MNDLVLNNFDEIVEEIQAIIVEKTYQGNVTFIELWHEVGKTIAEYGLENDLKKVSKAVGCSLRTVQKSVQFYKTYPDLEILYESHGKEITLNKVFNQVLPQKVTTLKEYEIDHTSLKKTISNNLDELIRTAERRVNYYIVRIPISMLEETIDK